MRSGWRRDGEVCSPEAVEGMQANIVIGTMAGVGLLSFKEFFVDWTGEGASGLVRMKRSDVERALSLA